MTEKSLGQRADPMLRIAKGWMILGIGGLMFIGSFAIVVFVFGEPLHEKYTGKLVPASDVAGLLSFMAVVASFFVAAGTALFFKLRKHGL